MPVVLTLGEVGKRAADETVESPKGDWRCGRGRCCRGGASQPSLFPTQVLSCICPSIRASSSSSWGLFALVYPELSVVSLVLLIPGPRFGFQIAARVQSAPMIVAQIVETVRD